MALLRFFKVSSDAAKLPDPRGPLSTKVPSSSIGSANAEVKRVIEESGADRGHYEKFSPGLKLQIGKRAAENGVAATMRFYAKEFVLKEQQHTKLPCTRDNHGS